MGSCRSQSTLDLQSTKEVEVADPTTSRGSAWVGAAAEEVNVAPVIVAASMVAEGAEVVVMVQVAIV